MRFPQRPGAGVLGVDGEFVAQRGRGPMRQRQIAIEAAKAFAPCRPGFQHGGPDDGREGQPGDGYACDAGPDGDGEPEPEPRRGEKAGHRA